MQNERYGFIGAGSITEAMLKGMLGNGLVSPKEVYVLNRKNDDRLEFFREDYGVSTTRDYKELASKCRTLIVAVKPQDVSELLHDIKEMITDDHIIITLAAGISTVLIENCLGKEIPIIRAMPNTSCQVKESATAIAQGRHSTLEARDLAYNIFSSVGKVAVVEEEMLDAVTGFSGSGPAYVYFFMEALTEAGTKVGLPRELSEELAVQTVFGAAKMVLETGRTPGQLKNRVTTPGGTTMAGMEILETCGFTDCIVKAVESATRRSKEMMKEQNSIECKQI